MDRWCLLHRRALSVDFESWCLIEIECCFYFFGGLFVLGVLIVFFKFFKAKIMLVCCYMAVTWVFQFRLVLLFA